MSDQFLVGDVRTIVILGPGAGNDWNYTIPTGLRLRIRNIAFQFVTDVNAANRDITLQVTDPVGGYSFNAVSQAVQAASLTYNYSFAPGNRDMAAAVNAFVSVPIADELILIPGENISSMVDNIQAGDNFAEIYILVEAFLLP